MDCIDVYEITYDYDSEYDTERNITDRFEGTWSELQEEIKRMKRNGCYNIDASHLYSYEETIIG